MNYETISPDEMDSLENPVETLFQLRKMRDGSFVDVFGSYPRECNPGNPPLFIVFGMTDRVETGDVLFNEKVGELTIKSVEIKFLSEDDPGSLQQFAYVRSPLIIRTDAPCSAPNT